MMLYRGIRAVTSSLKYHAFRLFDLGYPEEMNFAMTYRCDSRCILCGIWKKYLKKPSLVNNELTLREIDDFLERDSAYLARIKSIGLTGGEPLLRKDIVEIVQTLDSHLARPRFSLSTNGLNPNRVWGVANSLLDVTSRIGVNISLDGDERLHNLSRGVPYAYDEVLESIRLLTRLKKEVPDFGLAISFTISPENYTSMPFVYALASDLDASFSCRFIHRSQYLNNMDLQSWFLDSQLDEVETIVEEIGRGDIDFRKAFFLSRMIEHARNSDNMPIPCFSGFFSFFLDPYGNVYPCVTMNSKLGNIRNSRLKDIFQSKQIREVRRQIRQERCPICWMGCEALKNIRMNPISLLTWKLFS